MAHTLSINVKQGDQRHWGPPLRHYIETTYGGQWPQVADDAAELQSLREDAIAPEVHQNGVNKLIRYYMQITQLQSKVPIDESNVKVPFTWHNALDAKAKAVGSYAVAYEKAAVCFNIAAIYSQLAFNENKQSPEGVKNAALYLQNAAGAFGHIIDKYGADIGRIPSSDLALPVLQTLQSLMLAQAQECFWLKAAMEKMKDMIVARLATKAAEYYEATYDKANLAAPKLFGQAWLAHIYVKAHHFRAAAEYRKAVDCQANAKYGEECGRLAQADLIIKKALEQSKHVSANVLADLKSVQTIVLQNKAKADKDNDIIYHETVPAATALERIPPADMVKPIDFAATSDTGRLLFKSLVPYQAQQALGQYAERRKAIVQAQTNKVGEAQNLCNAKMQSLGLPGAIDALEQPIGLPATLLSNSKEVKESGGAQSLADQMAGVKALRVDCEGIFTSIKQMLDDEEAEDEQCRQKHGIRWLRKPSRELNARFRKAQGDAASDLAEAKKTDELVKVRYEKHLPFIEALSTSTADLEQSIPASNQQHTFVKNDPNVKRMKELMADLTGTRDFADKMIERFKATAEKDDIGASLTDSFMNKEPIDQIFDRELQKYDALRDELDDGLGRQAQILEELAAERNKWDGNKQSNAQVQEREVALQNLAVGYQQFKVIERNLAEGVEYYMDLKEKLQTLANEVKDFAFARNTEKRDYATDLSTQTGAAPAIPPAPSSQFDARYSTPPPATPPQQQASPAQPAYVPFPGTQPAYASPPHAAGGQQMMPPSNQYLPNYGYQATPQHMPGTWNPNIPLAFSAPPPPQQQPSYPGQQQSSPPQGYYPPQQPPFNGQAAPPQGWQQYPGQPPQGQPYYRQ